MTNCRLEQPRRVRPKSPLSTEAHPDAAEDAPVFAFPRRWEIRLFSYLRNSISSTSASSPRCEGISDLRLLIRASRFLADATSRANKPFLSLQPAYRFRVLPFILDCRASINKTRPYGPSSSCRSGDRICVVFCPLFLAAFDQRTKGQELWDRIHHLADLSIQSILVGNIEGLASGTQAITSQTHPFMDRCRLPRLDMA